MLLVLNLWHLRLPLIGLAVALLLAPPALSQSLTDNESVIVDELNAVQGSAIDIGGYFRPDPELAAKAMRPSKTFNAALDAMD